MPILEPGAAQAVTTMATATAIPVDFMSNLRWGCLVPLKNSVVSVVHDPRIERRDAARPEHALRHDYIDPVFEYAEIGMLVGAGELLRFRLGAALKFTAVEHDAAARKAGAGIACQVQTMFVLLPR